uniref:ATP-dependent RNA helicase DHX29 n=1 Tax=Poecilia formosa TaxID=48698 RepID=A0A096LXC9_POEFO
MGGKKKKSAAQAAPAAAAATSSGSIPAVGGTGAVEDQKKHAANSKTNKPAKETKSKAPKTYSLANTAQVDTGGVSDKSILKKVSIQAELEKKIIKLINDFRQENGDKGPISGRLTTKKLLDLYTALEKFNFKREHIEEAMKSSVLYGGDLHSALDWLCLNLKDDELPDGFSQQLQEESQKSRPKFQPPPQQKPAERNPKASNNSHTDANRVRALKDVSEKDEAASMKDWILRYAEQSSDDEEEEDEGDKRTRNPELDEKFDPNDRYLILTAQLYDAKEMAADAKTKGDKMGQRKAQDRIRVIQQEMKQLESHPMFNPAIKVVDVPQKEKKTLPVTDDKDDLSFSLFEQAEKDPPAEKVVRKNEPKDIRNFDYTARSWTGKSPKQFLIDWVRKNLPKSPPPAFHKVSAGRYWRCKVRVQRVDDALEVCPTILTEDSMQAQHLAATLALYNLVKGQSVHQLLPPTYRDVWLEWRDSEQQQQEASRTAANKPRDQFISRLLTRLKQQQNQSQAQQPAYHQGQELNRRAGEDVPEDSWENLAGLEIEEKGGRDEDKGVKSKQKEGAASLKSARELLLKLKESALAHKLQAEREKLPVFQHRGRVLEALQRHRVVVVAGETGSGKSTQIPQFLLEELLTGGKAARPCNIVVTQPRRISAMSLASRVSQELGCDDGPGSKSSLCGYQIRMENLSGDWTRLLYCTTGVLLRKLQQDRHLSSLTHIIVDEVHERSVQSDFLLTILKDVVMKRSDLHLILMSATVDCDKFSSYFNRCPVVSIPGRTFPVEVSCNSGLLHKESEYEEKYKDLKTGVTIPDVVFVIDTGKTKETFLPLHATYSGVNNHSSLYLKHQSGRLCLLWFNDLSVKLQSLIEEVTNLDLSLIFAILQPQTLLLFNCFLLLSDIFSSFLSGNHRCSHQKHQKLSIKTTLKHQSKAFKRSALRFLEVRKFCLKSTNIAETGVTIPDVVFVIDTGKTKENKYHESSQMSSLVETFVSKASALQRQGRAGRVRNGFCFRLYPKFRFDAFMDYSIPEILRVPLEELCLHIMKCQYGSPEDFLSRALDAPQPQSVSNAVNLLRKIGACQPDNHILTPLGHHLASLPVNVKIGKMLIYGAILGCLEPIATIAAAITEKSPFSTPMNRKEEANLAKAALATANSDHLTIYNAYMGWKSSQTEGLRAEMSYCRKHFLNRTALLTIEDVKHELMKMMEQAGFWSSRSKQRAAALSKQQICILNAALTAGLYDSVARVLCNPPVDGLERVACTVETPQGRAQVHPSSVNRNLQVHGWLLYQEKVKYTKIYLRDTTLVSPFPMLLFGGDIDIQHREKLMTLDGWIHFQAPVRIGVIFKHLRKLMDSLLERKLENPRMNLEGDATIQVILDLIKSEHAA